MTKHPELMEICREQMIALEVWPISSVVSFIPFMYEEPD